MYNSFKELPKLNSECFTRELYDGGLNILETYQHPLQAVKEFAIGYCLTSELLYKSIGNGEYAVMFEDNDGHKSWFHCKDYWVQRAYNILI